MSSRNRSLVVYQSPVELLKLLNGSDEFLTVQTSVVSFWAFASLIPHVNAHRTLVNRGLLSSFPRLQDYLDKNSTLAGDGPESLANADDVAYILRFLQLLGESISISSFMDRFEASDRFRFTQSDFDGDSTTNSIALGLMTADSDITQWTSQIAKSLDFISLKWSEGDISSRWNASPAFGTMILTEALLRFSMRWNESSSLNQFDSLVTQTIPLLFCQVISQVIGSQDVDGSWNNSMDITTYQVCSLMYCLAFPWPTAVLEILWRSVSRGRAFIDAAAQEEQRDNVWRGRDWSVMRSVYCSIASYMEPYSTAWRKEMVNCYALPSTGFENVDRMLRSVPLFQKHRLTSIDLVLIESKFLAGRLSETLNDMMVIDALPMQRGNYLNYIPVIWIACNQISGHHLSASLVWNMLLLSMFIYQIDELMESVATMMEPDNLVQLIMHIQSLCSTDGSETVRVDRNSTVPFALGEATDDHTLTGNSKLPSTLERVGLIITNFVDRVLKQPQIRQSPDHMQHELALEVQNFLLGHIYHNQNKTASQSTGREILLNSEAKSRFRDNYFRWVRTTASDDTSTKFAFQYFLCFISKADKSCIENARALYFCQSLVQHLATMCRQYNDYASAIRDAEEGNLNSLDFPEFTSHYSSGQVEPATVEYRKKELMEIAEFERVLLKDARRNFERVTESKDVLQSVDVFINVTDLFGQIYVLRDLSSRLRS